MIIIVWLKILGKLNYCVFFNMKNNFFNGKYNLLTHFVSDEYYILVINAIMLYRI